LDHLFHKLIHLNYWSEILRPPLIVVNDLLLPFTSTSGCCCAARHCGH
jgi:hypothetical protein